jgi:hypothetical protein
MIQAEEAIHPDQITPSIRPDRVRIFYPRGQTATVLLWMCDQNPPTTKIGDASIDNGFSQWVQLSNGDFMNPTDRLNAPPGKVVGIKL